MPTRRGFLRASAAFTGGLLLSRCSWASAQTAESRIEILLNEPLGAINPNVYGHFIEHLGGVVYDGVWVGENSNVSNIQGVRKELIDQLRAIKAPVIRYPGGCFADSYDWRDGVGPSGQRPTRTNFWAGAEGPNSPADHKYEPNRFGTNEFMRLCRLSGAQPYLAANLRSLPAEQFSRWVEYCNSPAGSTTLAKARAGNGSAEPFDVRYWGIGNESWGCGGNFTAQEYAVEYRRFATWVPSYGKELSLIASGPNSDDFSWTRGFLEEIARKDPGQLKAIYGLSLHHYAWNLSRGATSDWDNGKGDALHFDETDWYEVLREGERVEGLITGNWKIMGEFDSAHHIKLIVDEWGPWYKPGSEQTPANLLEQTPTLRDAVFSGMTLDIFNRHPDKVAMAACAQLVNCLNSPYLAHEDKFVVTPVGHVFGMYADHQGGQSVRTVISAPQITYQRDGKAATFWGLNGSASINGKQAALTVVNPSTKEQRETEIAVRGGTPRSANATVLTATDTHAANTFADRNKVVPREANVRIDGAKLRISLASASVTKVLIQME